MSTASCSALVLVGLGAVAYLASSDADFTWRDTQGAVPSASIEMVPQAALASQTAPRQDEVLPSSLEEVTAELAVQRPVRAVLLDQPSIPRGRDAIGRQLQKELQRVGCYAGELNGVWTTSTQHAMQAFLARVNAALPIDQPDGILLALVQGHPAKVCGAPCPVGQGFSHDTQCVPNAILAMIGRTKLAASTTKTAIPTTSARAVNPTVAGGAPSTEHPGDVALVDPAPAAAPAPGPTQRRVTDKNGRPPSVRRERSWASALFRFSFY